MNFIPHGPTMGRHTQAFLALVRSFPENTRIIAQTVIFSLAAALIAVAFLLMTNHVFAWTYEVYARHSKTFFIVASFITIMTSALAVGILLQLASPDAAGSGIPQLKAAYWKELGYVPLKPVLVKFIAGVLSLGGGLSLGREGPTVFMGGGMASALSGYTGVAKRLRRGAVVIGASAGLAAAFNTPLAAITFVLEEIVGDISSRSIGRVVISSVLGAFVVYAIIGRQPAFSLPSVEQVSWMHYLLVPLVASLHRWAGIIFQRGTLSWRAGLKKQKRIPAWLLPCCGAIITWMLGVGAFLATGKIGVFGLGYHDLSRVLHNDFVWWAAGILVACKLPATIASYSFGGCGGIFSPTLFIGGLSGFFIAGLLGHWVPLTPADTIVLSAVGMSACLGAVVRAPLSSLLIVFEMTHQFSMVPGLLLGMFISMLVSRMAGSLNFYDAVLVQDGHELIKIRPPLDLHSWQNLPIGTIANRRPIAATSLEEQDLRDLLEMHTYRAFPLVVEGRLQGILTREAITRALKEQQPPMIEKAVTCRIDQTVHAVADAFISSPSGVIVLTDPGSQSIAGIITLHDLLRAQASILD